jgi:O-antigen ligase
MFWILVGYMFLFIHRPFEVWPSLGPYRLELIYIAATGILWAVAAQKRWLPNPLHWAFFAMAVVVVLSWLASPFDRDEVKVTNYLKLFPFYLVLVTVVHDERMLRRILLAFLAVMFIYMLHSLREFHNGRAYFRMGIERMIGVDESMGDPNSFGATIVYALPLVIPFWKTADSTRLRVFLIGYTGLSILCIMYTGSRSAFVGLVLWVVTMVLRKEYRRWIVPTLVLAALVWFALPIYLQERFQTIVDPSAGPASAQTSAEGRIVGLKTGLALWARHPILGVGVGAWRPAASSKLESHNLYGEVLGETGTLGALAFLAIVLLFWWNQRRIAAAYEQHPQWGQDFLFYVNRALGVAIILLLIEGNFSHNLFRYTWLWYGGFLIITAYCIEQRLSEATFSETGEALAPQPAFQSAGEV